MHTWKERHEYFSNESERWLLSGVSYSEWCTYVSKSVYLSFVNGADLSTVITISICIEAFLRSELQAVRSKTFINLIDDYYGQGTEISKTLHEFRQYRNKWAHCGEEDDELLFSDETGIDAELEEWAFKSITILFEVLGSNPHV